MLKRSLLGLALIFGGTLALSACTQPVRVHGYIPDPEDVEQIEAGVHSRDDVFSILGSPSTISTFSDDKWYYIGQRSTQFAYELPDIFERSVLEISYDEIGFVTAMRYYDLEDGKEIEPVARVTPTEGRDFTVMQQLLGNFGRLPGGGNVNPGSNLPGP